MGTSGAGKFSDYSRSTEIDKCDEIIENELLESYGDYDYSQKSLVIPSVDTKVHIEVRERIIVVDTTGNSIGALSTEYEYIRECIQVRGYSFNGHINSSDNASGVVSIKVTLIGTKKKK